LDFSKILHNLKIINLLVIIDTTNEHVLRWTSNLLTVRYKVDH